MKYIDVVLMATEPRIVKAAGQKRLTFNLLVPRVFNDPIPRELNAIALRDLTNKAGGADADWTDAHRLGEVMAAALFLDIFEDSTRFSFVTKSWRFRRRHNDARHQSSAGCLRGETKD